VLSGHLIVQLRPHPSFGPRPIPGQGTLQKPMPLQPIGQGPGVHGIVQKKPPLALKSSQ
jgi:hypothetical protein